MSRIFTVTVLLLTLGLACLPLGAKELPSQQGLPSELTIAPRPALAEQLVTLQALEKYIQENRPHGGGFVTALRGMFAPSGVRAVPVAPEVLLKTPAPFVGKPVSVSGVYQATGPETGKFSLETQPLLISLPANLPMAGLPKSGPNGLSVTVEGIVESGALGVQVRATSIKPSDWLTLLRIGRIYELMGQKEQAEKTYESAFPVAQAARSPFAAFAKTSAGRIAYELRNVNRARNHYAAAWNPLTGTTPQGEPKYYTWVPLEDGSGWEKLPVSKAIGPPLDRLNKTDFWYRFMDFFVELAGGSRWLGIVLLSIMSRVIIWPLTKKQLASAEAMKRLQPQIKALQDRYADDKAKFQQEFWQLCQANGVNPLGGCLPMIVQMPILILLWKGIRNYIVQFDGYGFLWVKNLAAPDMGLLVAYTISMIAFQKMTAKLQASPTMTAQQAQQQQMMTYMMPLMFFFFFRDFPAAFLLYWLATNIVYFMQQYMYSRSLPKTDAADGEPLSSDKSGGFAGTMAKMMSMKNEGEEPPAVEKKSFHEKQAADQGKKIAKTPDKSSAKRGRK
ncbi:MAG: YidC/Oxa1 family membrane protein insertase [Armatimonadia bacterium]